MKAFLHIIGDAVKGALLLALALLLADSLAEQFILNHDCSKQLLTGCVLLIPIIGISLLGGWLIFRSGDEKHLMRAALAIVGLSLIARLIWIFAVDSYQVNDFGEYLNSALDLTDTLWRRAAFYTYPLVLLFGKSLLAVKITNVALATLTAWFFFLAGRIIMGARTAAVGLLFFIWHPELWYSITLASHDIPGLFWLGLFFYVSALLQRRLLADSRAWLRNSVLSLCVGVCIFFVGAVRSYEHGAILALAVCWAIHAVRILSPKARERSRFKVVVLHAMFLLVIPLCVYEFAEARVWKAFGVEFDGIGPGIACYLTATDVLGTSEHDEITNWYEGQCPAIPSTEQRTFAIRKLLHEVTHSPGAYLVHLERKNRVLARADAYLGWSTSRTYESWDTTHDQVKRINRFNYDAQKAAIALANALLLLLVLWRVALYPTHPPTLSEAIPIAFSAVYYCLFLFLLESQSRYATFMIFLFSWLAAQAVVDLQSKRIEKPVHVFDLAPRLKPLLLGGAALLASAVGIYWLASSLAADSALTLRDQTGFAVTPPGGLVLVRNNFKQLMVAYPVGSQIPSESVVGVQRTFTINPKPGHHLRFFLSTYSARNEAFAKQVTWEETDIEYVVAVNDRIIATGKVNEIAANRYFSFDSGDSSIFAPRMTIRLMLRNLNRIEKVDPNRGPLLSLEYIDLQ